MAAVHCVCGRAQLGEARSWEESPNPSVESAGEMGGPLLTAFRHTPESASR